MTGLNEHVYADSLAYAMLDWWRWQLLRLLFLTHVPALPYYYMFHESFPLQDECSLTEETFYMVLYGRCPQCFYASSLSSLPQNMSKVKSTLGPYH